MRKLAIKLAFSGALIAYVLLVQVREPAAIGAALGSVAWAPLLVGLSLHVSGLYLSALRWKILLGVQGIEARLGSLVKSYLVGGFFNLFLPTQIGGDVVRGLDTRVQGRSAARPFGAILVERLSGLFTLLVLACVALASGFSFPEKGAVTLGVALLLAGMLAGVAALFFPPLLRLLRRLGTVGPLRKVSSKLGEFHDSLTVYARHPGPFARALGVGLVLQINYVLHFYFIGEALHVGLPVAFYFVSVPVMNVVLLAPVSFSGVGLRESGFVVFFRLMGRTPADAVAFSLLGFAMTVLFGILGGVVYALRRAPVAGQPAAAAEAAVEQ